MTDHDQSCDLRESLVSTKVSEVTLTMRPTLSPGDTVNAAASAMRDFSHGSAVIVENEKLVGIFTERDLLRFIGQGGDMGSLLSDVMTTNPVTASTGDSLFDAIKSMDTGGYRRLPVIDDQGRPVGILDVKDVTHFIVELFPEAVYTSAAHAQLIARQSEGA